MAGRLLASHQMRRHSLLATALLAASLPAFATVFAAVHGVVHDPQHRPIAGAKITLQAADSAFVLHGVTNGDGEFELPEAPIAPRAWVLVRE